MLRSKWGLASVIIGYVAGLIAEKWFLPVSVALIFPILGTMLASVIRQAELKVAKLAAEREAANAGQNSVPPQSPNTRTIDAPVASSGSSAPVSPSSQERATGQKTTNLGSEWDQIIEYIGTIEDMVLLEGEKNNLDNEIVQRTLSLLVRLNRIIPQLVAFNNGDINHKIQRLVLKDLNGAINPFIHLSGEAKRQNRRILLNSIRDIDNQISTYTSFIEQKDLMELKNKAELIHQRYGARN
ncbi:hypothetical protein [Cohnella lupini]|uniref:5-bromo-4-chloroindolyl phosphate hydrolysis protein n=1 Tax=Cohnella lupini TaxID=1294267 RepID=A0A3D9IN00_9BACL|nr:hypothetical protein [Cohnella lupini]RED63153.1 hypothetical protein DFP95_104147 [Cohnella lupini]